jgi:VanZ family protein
VQRIATLPGESMAQKLYRYIFWTGYFAVLITSLLPIAGTLDKTKLGRGFFEIRLDHILHFFVYFLICMYYLFGQWKKLKLFNINPLIKFILLLLILAVVTEIVQLWIPERTFSPIDLLANVVGIMIGFMVIKLVKTSRVTWTL